MKKNISRILFLLLILALTGCMVKTPSYDGSTSIKILDEDKEAYINSGLIDYKTTLFNHTTDFMWTKDEILDAQKHLDKSLPNDKWRLVTDWSGDQNRKRSEWKNGDIGLIVILNGNLDGTKISDLERRYGINGIDPGATLIIMYAYDKNKPQPDRTATAEGKIMQMTKSAATPTPDHK